MAHGERERRVGARVDLRPLVGELRVICEVRGDDNDLGAAVAGLDHEVGVRRTGHRNVGAPHHEVGRVVPVARLWDVRLVAEGLRGGRRKVGVPVIERECYAADVLEEARAGAVGDLRHGRNNGEAEDAVGAVLTNGVDVCRGGHLDGLLVGDADESALAALRDIGRALVRVFLDGAPGEDRVSGLLLFLAVHVDEHATGVRVAHAGGRVGVPGEGGTTRAAARFVFRHVIAGGGVVHCLGLPGDDAVFDIDLPRAGTGAVHAVRRTDHLVEGPAVAVEDISLAAALEKQLLAGGAGLAVTQVGAQLEQRVEFAILGLNVSSHGGKYS